MRLIRRNKNSELIDAALRDTQARGFFKLQSDPNGRAFYNAIHGSNLQEHTFALEHAGEIVALVECDDAEGGLGRFGFAIEPQLKADLPFEVRRQIAVDIIAELKRLAKEHEFKLIRVRNTPDLDPDGLLLGQLTSMDAEVQLEVRAEADLSLNERMLFDDLRKGHRQQVRWGEKNLTISFVDRDRPDHEVFDTYREFHAEVAGRTTRAVESWNLMFSSIAAGRGDLVLGYLDGQMVSGSLILDGGDAAYYATGVYHRGHFDKPLAHATLFRAIIRAKQRGLRMFDVGEIPHSGSGKSDKELSIGYFKRGFTSRTITSAVITWRSGDAAV